MGAKILRIEEHPRYKRQEKEIPTYVLDDPEEVSIDQFLEEICEE